MNLKQLFIQINNYKYNKFLVTKNNNFDMYIITLNKN